MNTQTKNGMDAIVKDEQAKYIEGQPFAKRFQMARAELSTMKLPKSGKNKYAGYEYYELQDFMPAVTSLMYKYNLTSFMSITDHMAELRILDVHAPVGELAYSTGLTFICPVATVEIGKKEDGTGGAQPIQNLGAQITYLRRYLYMMAFDITESDAVDASAPVAKNVVAKPAKSMEQAQKDMGGTVIETTKTAQPVERTSTPGQQKAIFAISKSNGHSKEDVATILGHELIHWTDITFQEASDYIDKYGKKSIENVEQFATPKAAVTNEAKQEFDEIPF